MKKYSYIVFSAAVLLACGNNENKEQVSEEALESETTTIKIVKSTDAKERVEKAQMVFKTIPSPLETASLFQEAGVGFDSEVMNPVENVKSYATSIDQSLNLGVYGADLSFANIFGQTQESMKYMNCAKILADELGITSAFDSETMTRIEENMNNRDSLMLLINHAFWLTDAHMKENGQQNLSGLIIAGGWIEGLYLGGLSLDPENPSKLLMQRIADQKYSLNSLIDLLNTFENSAVLELVEKLEKLQLVYNKIEVEKGETTLSNNNGVATIGGGNVLKFNKETIFEITETIQKIRNEIIS